MALRPVTLLAAFGVALYTVLQTANFITLILDDGVTIRPLAVASWIAGIVSQVLLLLFLAVLYTKQREKIQSAGAFSHQAR